MPQHSFRLDEPETEEFEKFLAVNGFVKSKFVKKCVLKAWEEIEKEKKQCN